MDEVDGSFGVPSVNSNAVRAPRGMHMGQLTVTHWWISLLQRAKLSLEDSPVSLCLYMCCGLQCASNAQRERMLTGKTVSKHVPLIIDTPGSAVRLRGINFVGSVVISTSSCSGQGSARSIGRGASICCDCIKYVVSLTLLLQLLARRARDPGLSHVRPCPRPCPRLCLRLCQLLCLTLASRLRLCQG